MTILRGGRGEGGIVSADTHSDVSAGLLRRQWLKAASTVIRLNAFMFGITGCEGK